MATADSGGAVDFAYLEAFTGGEMQVVKEVLALFVDQARTWEGALHPDDAGWRDVVHTIKGAARGIGAGKLGDMCAQAEAEGSSGLSGVRAALTAAVQDIAAYLARANGPTA